MRILVLLLAALGMAHASWGGDAPGFKAALEAMGSRDHDGRQKLSAESLRDRLPQSAPQYADMRKLQRAIDLRNQGELDTLVQRYGWPDVNVVGTAAATAAFDVVRHARPEYQKKYLPLLRTLVSDHQVQPGDLAVLEDSVRVGAGRRQIYGTRVHFAPDGEPLLYPLEDPQQVDARRAQVGLGPLAEYLKSVDQRYGTR